MVNLKLNTTKYCPESYFKFKKMRVKHLAKKITRLTNHFLSFYLGSWGPGYIRCSIYLLHLHLNLENAQNYNREFAELGDENAQDYFYKLKHLTTMT